MGGSIKPCALSVSRARSRWTPSSHRTMDALLGGHGGIDRMSMWGSKNVCTVLRLPSSFFQWTVSVFSWLILTINSQIFRLWKSARNSHKLSSCFESLMFWTCVPNQWHMQRLPPVLGSVVLAHLFAHQRKCCVVVCAPDSRSKYLSKHATALNLMSMCHWGADAAIWLFWVFRGSLASTLILQWCVCWRCGFDRGGMAP